MNRHFVAAALLAASSAAASTPAHAIPAITPANQGRGFVITEFARRPGAFFGDRVAYTPNLGVLVSNYGQGELWLIPSHADSQIVTAANLLKSYSENGLSHMVQVLRAGVWHYYASSGTDLVEFDPA